MNFKTLSCAACLLLMATTSSFAMTMDYSFSFNNFANGDGLVTGVIRGLEDGTGAATSVEVLSNTNPLGFGIGEYVSTASNNLFTVTAGIITESDFISIALGSKIRFFSGPGFFDLAGLSAPDASFVTGISTITFEPLPPSSVPLPPTIVLFLTGLAGLAGFSRWKKSTA